MTTKPSLNGAPFTVPRNPLYDITIAPVTDAVGNPARGKGTVRTRLSGMIAAFHTDYPGAALGPETRVQLGRSINVASFGRPVQRLELTGKPVQDENGDLYTVQTLPDVEPFPFHGAYTPGDYPQLVFSMPVRGGKVTVDVLNPDAAARLTPEARGFARAAVWQALNVLDALDLPDGDTRAAA